MTAATTIIESIASRFRLKQTQDTREYSRLIVAVVGGHEIDADGASLTLAEAGKSPDDLHADVERHRNRLKWAKQIAGQPAAREEAEAAEKEIESLRRKCDEDVRKRLTELDEALRPWHRKREDAQARRTFFPNPHDELRRTASPELKQREAALLARLRDERSGHGEMVNQVKRFDHAVQLHERDSKTHQHPGPNKSIDELRQRLKASQAEASRLQAELEQCRSEMLVV